MYHARRIALVGSLSHATKAFDKIGTMADHSKTTPTEGQVFGSLLPAPCSLTPFAGTVEPLSGSGTEGYSRTVA